MPAAKLCTPLICIIVHRSHEWCTKERDCCWLNGRYRNWILFNYILWFILKVRNGKRWTGKILTQRIFVYDAMAILVRALAASICDRRRMGRWESGCWMWPQPGRHQFGVSLCGNFNDIRKSLCRDGRIWRWGCWKGIGIAVLLAVA